MGGNYKIWQLYFGDNSINQEIIESTAATVVVNVRLRNNLTTCSAYRGT